MSESHFKPFESKDPYVNEILNLYNEGQITAEEFLKRLKTIKGTVVLEEDKIYAIKGGFIMGLLDLVSESITKEIEMKKTIAKLEKKISDLEWLDDVKVA